MAEEKNLEKKTAEKKKDGAKQKIAKFFKDYKSEFKKIVWPSKETTIRQSAVVLVSIVVSGIAIWLLDTGFSRLFELIGNLI